MKKKSGPIGFNSSRRGKGGAAFGAGRWRNDFSSSVACVPTFGLCEPKQDGKRTMRGINSRSIKGKMVHEISINVSRIHFPLGREQVSRRKA